MFILEEKIERYAWDRTRPEPELLQQLAEETQASMEYPQMLCGRLEGRFLKCLVQMTGARRILELGMFTGYSALSMAEGLPKGGRIITCEINPKARELAQSYFSRSPHGSKIEIRMGPALDTLNTLPGPFDMVFVDADKVNYVNYYESVIEKVRSGGIIVIDNSLWSGRVLEPDDASARTIDALNRMLYSDNRVENVLLTIRDGIHLVRKN